MMKFRSRPQNGDEPALPNTVIGVGTSLRGTLMVTGTLRIDGEFEGDILNCDRLEVGELGNIRALATIEMKSGARVEGDVAAVSVAMEPGVYFTGRCTMLDTGFEGVELGASHERQLGR